MKSFFNSYCRVLIDGINLNTNIEDDRADFYTRRIEDYEQTVRVLAARLQEAFATELPLHVNISRLLDISATVRNRLQDRIIQQENRQLEDLDESNFAPVESRVAERRGDGVANQGRPRISLNGTEGNNLRRLGFSWTDIARMLGVSSRTLRRRHHESGTFSDVSYANITNDELDNIVRGVLQVTPQAGRNLVRGALLSRGLLVQRRRIESSIARVDPVTTALRDRRTIIRRIYNVPCPNFLW